MPDQETLKVQVLLQEYSTLRTEMIQRNNNIFTLVTVGGAVALWWANSNQMNAKFWGLLVAAILIFSLLGWITHRDIEKAAERVREIEDDVNRRLGDEVLVWETLWGGAVTGYFCKARPLPRKGSGYYQTGRQ